MSSPEEILDVVGRFEAALNAHDLDTAMNLVSDDVVFESTSPAPDGARYEGGDALRSVLGDMLVSTPKARFSTEEQFCDGTDRAVVRWRYEWGQGHIRGVDILRIRDGKIAESLAYVKG
jgi:ketosteroid isomerase-like protein